MSREVNVAESFETVYNAFSNINFSGFDFNTVKESLIEYVKNQYPESFNDYIESSEMIAILEIFAYISELYAYRLDINAHENFITLAQRKQSVLRLAKLLSYSASRNIPARGLLKFNSVKTTENIFDSNGVNLANRTIRWNDPNNSGWREQFLLVMNRVLKQEFGTVAPDERVQIDDVLFELYELNNTPLLNGVFTYSALVSGESINMEIVPSGLSSTGVFESRPDRNAVFSLLYGNDGLGDGSDTTGFFVFTKQGSLTSQTQIFDGVTPNQIFDLTIDNINNTDIWINNIDVQTGNILDDGSVTGAKSGEWESVDLAHAQNIIFNTNPNRNKYELETLEDDQVKIIFGDGEFANIPSGSFDLWFRSSLNRDITIPKNSVINQLTSFTYVGADTNVQTLSFEYSLINSIQNAAPSEELEHIRRVAPAVYYTQDRMVNNPDYNSFPLQDTTILKLRSLNRTYAGDSKYITWHDPRETYEDVKLFGGDMALYFKAGLTNINIINGPLVSNVFNNFIVPLLSSTDFFTILTSRGVDPTNIRTSFTADESTYITQEMTTASLSPPTTLELYYTVSSDHWFFGKGIIIYYSTSDTIAGTDNLYKFDILASTWLSAQQFTFQTNTAVFPNSFPLVNDLVLTNAANIVVSFGQSLLYRWTGAAWLEVPMVIGAIATHPNVLGIIPGSDPTFVDPTGIKILEITALGSFNWDLSFTTERIIAHSDDTRFWNVNTTDSIISFDTLLTNADNIVILQANARDSKTTLLSQNWHFNVIGQELLAPNIAATGLPDIHQLSILPIDTDEDSIPNNMDLAEILDPTYISSTSGDVVVLNQIVLNWDIIRSPITGGTIQYSFEGGVPFTAIVNDVLQPPVLIDTIHVVTAPVPSITFNITDYVYFQREEIDEITGEFTWNPIPTTEVAINQWINRASSVPEQYKREHGRFPLNFLWQHRTPRFNLVDPSPTNIIDMYIITRGYYNDLLNYLNGLTNIVPEAPSSLTLKNTYSDLIENKMISDTVILHSGKFKILFGSLSIPELRAKFKIIKSPTGILTDNQIKVRIIGVIQEFFDINDWEFGETFYFTEMIAKIHVELRAEIDSIVIVPLNAINSFGDLFQIRAREDEIFQPHITVNDLEFVESFNPTIIRQ